jgi:murein L,D-transpeptidase YafK
VNPSARADKIVIFNRKREMSLLKGGEVLKTHRASLGNHPVGAKTRTGDGRTPKKDYTLDWMNPQSRFHLSMHISYLNLRDMKKARRQGVQPGGDITVHGLLYGLGVCPSTPKAAVESTSSCGYARTRPQSVTQKNDYSDMLLGWIGPYHRFWDWSNGSIAVTNHEREKIWRAVPDGTQIAIDP